MSRLEIETNNLTLAVKNIRKLGFNRLYIKELVDKAYAEGTKEMLRSRIKNV